MWFTWLGRLFTPEATPTASYKPRFKVTMVGDSGVGKTNLLRQHVNNQFTDTHLPTIGIEFGLTHHTVDGNTAASAVIWDTSGSERFGRGFRSSYLRCSHGVMLVYDATSRSTFESLRKELEQVRENVYHDAVIMLVGNKMDLESDRAVSALEGADFAAQQDMLFIEVSARTGDNVAEAFATLLKQIYQKKQVETAR